MSAFLPAFGNKPEYIIGRNQIKRDFIDALSLPIGHPNRATLLIGQRGTGKTTLLLDFAEAAEKASYVCARVSANDEMLNEIIQIIQIFGSKFIGKQKTNISGLSLGALGFSVGLSFSDEAEKQLGFRMKLSILSDELAKHKKSILLLVDEVNSNTSEMRTLATTYQHLVGEQKNIAIVMAGLPGSMSAVLNDDVLTFLNRAHKVYLQPLPYGEISVAYKTEFEKQGKSITPENLEALVLATRGYPYLFQLIGYYTLEYAKNHVSISEQTVSQAIGTSKREMIEGIFSAALKPLSKRDRDFLIAMSKDVGASKIADIQMRMNVSRAYAQSYRTRLIESGVIAAADRGELEFEIPYLGEYLRGDF